MKKKRRLFGILLVITALIIMQLPVAEADAASSASDFKMEGNTLVQYRGTDKNVSVPVGVEIIGADAFSDNVTIEKVVLPDSVTKIEPYAFWGCENLETVILGEGLVEVGDYVFANCKGLKQMTIPENIRSIGIQSFVDCVNLTDIKIAPEVTGIHETAFDGCYKLMIHAETGSFADKYAEEFYVRQKEMPEYEDVSDYNPDDDTEADNADEDGSDDPAENESSGNMLGSTTVVGNQAVVFVDNTDLKVHDGKDDMEELETDKQNQSITAVEGIPKYTIVDGKIIADQAYYKNKNLKKITIPEGIVEIGQFAFARSNVTEIMMPQGIETIGYGAFYHCDSLCELELPQTIMNVEPKAFTYTAWVDDFMQNGTDDFLISGDVLVAYRGNSRHVTIPEGVRVIAGEVFAGHSEINEIALPDSLVVIGEAAFADCKGLRSVFWGDRVQFIKDRAFAGCALTTAEIPASVEELGVMAFDENVRMLYGGSQIPGQSHETSAERLSNEAYRPSGEDKSNPGVTVYGVDNAYAHLEGASGSYVLTVAETADLSAMEQAFKRNLQSVPPVDMILYDMQFTDNSGIPITKLGKQSLKITLPVPESLASKNLQIYTLDRNGQLEELDVVRVKLDGVDSFRFTTDYVSLIGVAGSGTDFNEDYIFTETTTIADMSSGPMQEHNIFPIQWIFGGAVMCLGILCIFWKK